MLPTINTYCATCKERWPFNPVLSQSFFTAYTTKDCGIKQCFYLTYECQNCKRDFVSFIVSRVANKIQLSGREPIEALPVPVCLPNGPAKYYSSGLIAHHAGQTLAGLFLLRVFVEQFWKSVPEVKALLAGDPRATGEKQGDAYQSTLPPDFKSRFPSLRDIYGKLSEAMHGAKDDANIFDSCSADIVEHFEARKLFKIK
jgi:hypothetical protein